MSSTDNSTYSRFSRVARVARYATAMLFIVVFTATHYPVQELPLTFISYADKIAHCLIYAALSFAVLTSWELSAGLLRPQHYFTVWLAGTLYGAFDEVTQIPVGRHCDGLDWLCDIVGIIVGMTLFRVSRPLLYRVLALVKVPVSSAV